MHSGEDALALIEVGKRYDVILCDLMMPQVTGMAVYEGVLALDPEQASRMVFLTGGAFTAAARTFLDTIPNRCVEKPFDLVELRQIVNDAIR